MNVQQVKTKERKMAIVGETLLTRVEVARLLNVSPQTLSAWGMRKRNIPFVKCGKLVRYRLPDVQNFIESRLVGVGGDEER
jgi:excisionase family DNA binding protein